MFVQFGMRNRAEGLCGLLREPRTVKKKLNINSDIKITTDFFFLFLHKYNS